MRTPSCKGTKTPSLDTISRHAVDEGEIMRKIGDINTIQVRIIGALLEKEQATPDYYPPTTNALLAACNQKSNRDPVMKLQQAELMDELEVLRTDVLIWRNDSGRVPKWSQSISRRLGLS